ncbi:sulfonate ABC transporter substrate-binding protein [Longimycelium tulufanense]|uniref:Sulfonate ABC transporter substrate-binding protein n=1 Tax=Longimycelium tulufanense TaxID=907463 RepID=A0A8J3FZ59_9PSEU|nr:ABC transporter substrate-binding protein [Longimycelium tulufanense]GGM81864.1 sulfonate ABC transporter substrate-binding protein [Longimycelium tulufanense]
MVGLLVCCVLVLSGCSLLGGRGNADAGPGSGGLELARVRVGALPSIDVAPLHYAQRQRYFAEAGLEVEIVTVPSGAESVTQLVGGSLDIAFSTYPAFVTAQAKGAGDLKIVAEAQSAKPGTSVIATGPHSAIRRPQDLAGRTVAVTAVGTMASALVEATARVHGVDPRTLKWAQMGFPEMTAALQRGDVDAALLAEPFITLARKKAGARVVVDTGIGPTEGIPYSGYGVTTEWAQTHPKTLAAFQRVMKKAQQECDADNTKIRDTLPTYVPTMDHETAQLVTIGAFHSSIEPTRIQRVPDLLHAAGILDKRVNIHDMIIPMPQ